MRAALVEVRVGQANARGRCKVEVWLLESLTDDGEGGTYRVEQCGTVSVKPARMKPPKLTKKQKKKLARERDGVLELVEHGPVGPT